MASMRVLRELVRVPKCKCACTHIPAAKVVTWMSEGILPKEACNPLAWIHTLMTHIECSNEARCVSEVRVGVSELGTPPTQRVSPIV